MENILITGVSGSGGSYLAEYIVENHKDIKVWGLCRWHSTASLRNLENIREDIVLEECDLMDLSSVIRVLQKCQPTRIFHLAAYANVRKAFDTPLAVINNNIMGTANLLEAARMVCPDAIVQICSSSEVYGNPKTTPMVEDHPIMPVNPYSVSKLSQESLGYAYHKSWGMNVILTRMFAYINPRRTDLFASSFATQIAEIEVGKRDVLRHGNLDSVRTLIDVRDAMESYWVACDKCEPGVPYNIGGETVITVGEFLDILKKHAKVPIETYQDPDLLRPVDITLQIPDTTKFYDATGWKPKISADDSIKFLLEHCRSRV
jgi:GDPmannose 4,6-dehydratase/GDP-4-dehydro-6-deoxy-D-mannose reductase